MEIEPTFTPAETLNVLLEIDPADVNDPTNVFFCTVNPPAILNAAVLFKEVASVVDMACKLPFV